jgi:hypothetical protein
MVTAEVATGLDTGRETSAATEKAPSFGPMLLVWVALTLAIHGVLWVTGFPPSGLAAAVEQGAAKSEELRASEVGDDLIRKAVRTQHETLPFWTVLALLGDFLGEPLALALRALAVATAFSATAALVGRPIGYDRALAACAAAQGFWVLGLAVHAALMLALRRTDVETSALLALAPGSYSAAVALWLRQFDVFSLLGWTTLARGGVNRGQVSLPAAIVLCGGFWLAESVVRVSLGLLTGAAMRLTVMPG